MMLQAETGELLDDDNAFAAGCVIVSCYKCSLQRLANGYFRSVYKCKDQEDLFAETIIKHDDLC